MNLEINFDKNVTPEQQKKFIRALIEEIEKIGGKLTFPRPITLLVDEHTWAIYENGKLVCYGTHLDDRTSNLKPGDLTATMIDESRKIHVQWDNSSRTAMLEKLGFEVKVGKSNPELNDYPENLEDATS